jgi:hypothetical protein
MNSILRNKFNLLFILIVLISAITVFLWAYTIYDNQSRTNQVQGVTDGRIVIFSDEFIDIFDSNKISITEEKQSPNYYDKPVVKRWFNFYEKDGLKNGFEAFYMMDQVTNNDETMDSWIKKLGITKSPKEKILGCNDNIFYKLSDNNVLPINYYLTIKGNRVFLLKHYDQLKPNKYFLNVNNFCLKN